MAEDYNPAVINALNAQKRAQNLLSYGYADVVDPVDETFVPMAIIPKKVKLLPYEAESFPYTMQDTGMQEENLLNKSLPERQAKFEFISSAYGSDKFGDSKAIPGDFNVQTIIQKGKQAYTQGVDRLKNRVKEFENFDPSIDFNTFKQNSPTSDTNNNKSFISDIWGPYYQSDNDPVKNKAALNRLNIKDWQVPESEKEPQSIAGDIFEGDSGYSKQDIVHMLGKIGQIESQYRNKIQQEKRLKKEERAYSYYQVEPKTALSLLTHSKAIFGPKFEDAFSMYAVPGKTAREVLSELTLSEMADQLLFDPNLGATLAAGKIVATTKKK